MLFFVSGATISNAYAQEKITIRGVVVDDANKPIPYAIIEILPSGINFSSLADGKFSFLVPSFLQSIQISVSHIGKLKTTRTVLKTSFGDSVKIVLKNLNLQLENVEVNAVRKSTIASNSSIFFDRTAIEQAQPLSLANVLNYLPGQTVLKPVVSIQGNQPIIMRSAIQPGNLEQELNNAFGVSIVMDGSVLSNNANMQATNPGFMGIGSANDIQHPENGVIGDRSVRNGTLYRSYGSISANNGLDLRQIPTENIESVEVVSGVASAKYGDYTTGVVIVNRQAGITPWRVSIRSNEGTQNFGVNKGFKPKGNLGSINLGFDYLHSNDDPRNKLKGYERISGSMLWSFQTKGKMQYKNTFSLDYGTTLDRTKLDPDQGNQRMSKFSNRNFRISNRGQWQMKSNWINSVSWQASYSKSREESYDQWYLNGTVIPIGDARETGTYEGYYGKGYYLAMHHILGEPVTASARIETNSIFKLSTKSTYRLSVGANYSYSANKGPGVLSDPERPRFKDQGYKNDRPRNYRDVPVQSNVGVYAENNFNTSLFGKPFSANLGLRGDFQNEYFTVSPRINTSLKLNKILSWKGAYGIATKAPSLSQISPGNVYFDIPLINIYNAQYQLYLVHTKVIELENLDLKPYKSITYETGFTIDKKKIQGSVYFFNRINKDGFAQISTLVPVKLPVYSYTIQGPGQPVLYQTTGRDTTYSLSYNRMGNGTYNRTNGIELMVGIEKIKAIQTSFSMSASWYKSYYLNALDDVSIPSNPDFTKVAVYGVFKNQERKSTNIKSSLVSTTHIPSLRMAVMFTTEMFWVNKTENLASGIYPTGYLDRNANYFPLTAKEAQLPAYAHLVKVAADETISYLPSFVYTNIHMRLSKEIGESIRFSFNGYNIFNIRPKEKTTTGLRYYNGQPSFGAELIFTLK